MRVWSNDGVILADCRSGFFVIRGLLAKGAVKYILCEKLNPYKIIKAQKNIGYTLVDNQHCDLDKADNATIDCHLGHQHSSNYFATLKQ